MAILCLIWPNELNFLLLFLLKYMLWINWMIDFPHFCVQTLCSDFLFPHLSLWSLSETFLVLPQFSNSISNPLYLQENYLTLIKLSVDSYSFMPSWQSVCLSLRPLLMLCMIITYESWLPCWTIRLWRSRTVSYTSLSVFLTYTYGRYSIFI